MKKMSPKEILTRLVTVGSTIAFYLPVVAGILTPMVWLLASWYIAWDLLALILPFSGQMSGLYLVNNIIIRIIAWTIEAIVMAIGLALFLWALYRMVIVRAKEGGLVTSGPYGWVRHPQHLGIILFLLPIALLQVALTYTYITAIRPGDIVSWMFVTFLLLITADYEEVGLARRFGEEYEVYRQKVPFIIPRLRTKIFPDIAIFAQGRYLRYIVSFFIFWALATLVLFISIFVGVSWVL